MPTPLSLAVCSAGGGVCGGWGGSLGIAALCPAGRLPVSPDLREKLPLTVSRTCIRCGHRGRHHRGPTCSPSSLPRVSPQKSVRLVVNYLRTQKAVVRVSPEVPLHSLLPVICAKCDVSPEHVVLLRDNVAGEELELSKSLSELGIKELYAWDNQRGEALGTRGDTEHTGKRGSTW